MVVDDGCVEDLGDLTVLGGLVHQIGSAVHVVGTENDVDPRRLVAHQVAVLLGETTGHHDLAPLTLTLPTLQNAESAVELVVGVLADAARVEDHYVGLGL